MRYLLLFSMLFLSASLTVGQSNTTCVTADLSRLTLARLDTLFDLAIQQEQFNCAIRVYQRISTLRNHPRDHFRAGLSYYNMQDFPNSKLKLEQALTPDSPLIWNYYYLGEVALQHSRDTTLAARYWMEEITHYDSSSFTYLRAHDILSKKGDYEKLIQLEQLSNYDNRDEDLKIGTYYERLGRNEEAIVHYKKACNRGSSSGCFAAYGVSSMADAKERIAYLEDAVRFSKGYIKELREFYQPRDSTELSLDSTYLTQEYNTTLSYYHFMLAKEYDSIPSLGKVIEHCDLALTLAKGTDQVNSVFDGCMQYFHKYGAIDKITHYEDLLAGANRESRSQIESLTITPIGEYKRWLVFLDSLSTEDISRQPFATIMKMLEAYESLNYLEDFDLLVGYIENKYPSHKDITQFNYMCLTHYESATRYKSYLDNLMNEKIYLSKDSLTLSQVFDVFVAQHRYYFGNENRKKSLESLDKLNRVIITRGEMLPESQKGLMAFYRGLTYRELCTNASDCDLMAEQFKLATQLNPDLLQAINTVSDCKCRSSH